MSQTSSRPFVQWTVRFMLIWTVTVLIPLLVIAVVLGVPIRSIAIPFLLFLSSGLVCSNALFWAQRADSRPRVKARRGAVAFYLVCTLYGGALLVTVVRFRIITAARAWTIGPYIALAAIVGSLGAYLTARSSLLRRT